jgi:hypothetical protein
VTASSLMSSSSTSSKLSPGPVQPKQQNPKTDGSSPARLPRPTNLTLAQTMPNRNPSPKGNVTTSSKTASVPFLTRSYRKSYSHTRDGDPQTTRSETPTPPSLQGKRGLQAQEQQAQPVFHREEAEV